MDVGKGLSFPRHLSIPQVMSATTTQGKELGRPTEWPLAIGRQRGGGTVHPAGHVGDDHAREGAGRPTEWPLAIEEISRGEAFPARRPPRKVTAAQGLSFPQVMSAASTLRGSFERPTRWPPAIRRRRGRPVGTGRAARRGRSASRTNTNGRAGPACSKRRLSLAGYEVPKASHGRPKRTRINHVPSGQTTSRSPARKRSRAA